MKVHGLQVQRFLFAVKSIGVNRSSTTVRRSPTGAFDGESPKAEYKIGRPNQMRKGECVYQAITLLIFRSLYRDFESLRDGMMWGKHNDGVMMGSCCAYDQRINTVT
jgi:hypothetical protein